MKQLLRLFLTSLLLIPLSMCASSQKNTSAIPLEIPADIAGLVSGKTITPEEYALMDRMGVSWELATFYWSRIEPAENQWNFDFYDRYVDNARANGKKVLGLLAYDVAWLHGDSKRRDSIPPDKLPFFLDYVRQTAAHFQGRVDAWCIWNEPNSSHFWKGSKDDFFLLTRQTADVVREVDPDAALLGGAFNRGVFGLPKSFIRGLFESGAMENVDAVAFHPYELNPARTESLYGKFRALVAQYGFADRIWITEVGYPTGGWYPTATTEKKFPAYVVKTFVNLAVSGAQKIIWYQLFDPDNRENFDSEDFFGLVRSEKDHTSKGAEAFRLCAVYVAGTVHRPDLPLRKGLPRSLRSFYFEQAEGGALVLWKDKGSAQVKLQTSNGDNADGFTVHDPVSGKAAPAETILTVGAMPVIVTWQGNYQPILSENN